MNTTGYSNVTVGDSAGANLTGVQNSSYGDSSSISVTGDQNTSMGSASGNSVTGSGNTTIGVNSGEAVIGSNNSAIGLGAGESVTGNANIAIGQAAGLGSGASFSNAISIGTSASANQTSAVAIGANATAGAANSVALGANSVATEPNTVSVGSPGSERRITNVAPGVNSTDAATYGQLTSAISTTQNEINQVGSLANKGIAMSMAQAGAGSSIPHPGEMAISMGSGYFEGEAAMGVGVAGASKSGERVFRLASSMTPGFGDIGVQASYQMRLGKGAPPIADSTEKIDGADIPYTEWKKFGFHEVRVYVPSRLYQARVGNRTFRFELASVTDDNGPGWAASVEEQQRDDSWRILDQQLNLSSVSTPMKALLNAITALSNSIK